MMRILEKVPKVSLRRGTGAAAEVFLLVALLLLCGEEPPGPVVGVLTAGLHVEVVQAPVLQLLAEVLNTNLQHGTPVTLVIINSGEKTYPGGQMKLAVAIQTKNGVKVPR